MTPYPIREEYGMEFPVLWSGLSSFIHEFGEIANGLIAAANDAFI